MNRRVISIFQAIIVTFLWSSSFIIIKKNLSIINPVIFAGLRYFVASLFLFFVLFKEKYRKEIKSLKKHQWMELIALGFVFYVLTQGTQFIGLKLLPSATVSLMLNFTPIVVIIFGVLFIGEQPSKSQIAGVILFITGAIVFFIPLQSIGPQVIGLSVMIIGVVSNAISSILGRKINRNKDISPYAITLVSMTFGSLILLSFGVAKDGIPVLPVESYISILWLAAINTAFAFTLWNRTLRELTSTESSVINGTMLIQIAILARIFLDEEITIGKLLGMLIASLGAILVQLRLGKINTKIKMI